MSLVRNDLFNGRTDLVETAMERLRFYEGLALQMHPDGFYVADSGGKDSTVIVDLCERAGVKHTCHFHPTTVDPPELLRFLRRNRPDTQWDKPTTTMWNLIEKKMMPPTGLIRYCCQYLKEGGGRGRFVVLGVRWQESARRKRRQMVEACYKKDSNRRLINPIIEWSENDVWDYHDRYDLPHCCLYDEGFSRIGCVGCPCAGPKGMAKEFERWPGYRDRYIKAFGKAVARRRGKNEYDGEHAKWTDGQAMFDWWMRQTPEDGDGPLFG